MKTAEIKNELIALISPRMKLLGIREREINDRLDLVSSGFVNSMEFVELVGDLETKFGVEIDFEKVTGEDGFTTVGGLIKLFGQYIGK